MSKPTRADEYLFFLDFASNIQKAMKSRVTVTRYRLDRADIDFEVRITQAGRLRMPAVRRPISRKAFEQRLIRANARGLLPEKVAS